MSSTITSEYEEGDRIEIFDTVQEALQKFGEAYGWSTYPMTHAQLAAVLTGHVVAFDVQGWEYVGVLVLSEEIP